jgi:hypothetical protein
LIVILEWQKRKKKGVGGVGSLMLLMEILLS